MKQKSFSCARYILYFKGWFFEMPSNVLPTVKKRDFYVKFLQMKQITWNTSTKRKKPCGWCIFIDVENKSFVCKYFHIISHIKFRCHWHEWLNIALSIEKGCLKKGWYLATGWYVCLQKVFYFLSTVKRKFNGGVSQSATWRHPQRLQAPPKKNLPSQCHTPWAAVPHRVSP